jgi:hypothetical protein
MVEDSTFSSLFYSKGMSHELDWASWPGCLDLSTNKRHRWFLSFVVAPLILIDIEVFFGLIQTPVGLQFSNYVGGFFQPRLQVNYNQ